MAETQSEESWSGENWKGVEKWQPWRSTLDREAFTPPAPGPALVSYFERIKSSLALVDLLTLQAAVTAEIVHRQLEGDDE